MRVNILEYLENTAARLGDKLAFSTGEEGMTFSEVQRGAAAIGSFLSERGFCLRTGLHCAPLAHKALGTDNGGAVRLSFGLFNGADEIDALCEEIKNIACSAPQ